MYKEQMVGSYKKRQVLENNTYFKLSLMFNTSYLNNILY